LSIPDPDPKTARKERGEKKIFVLPFFVATKITKLINFEPVKKKVWTSKEL
jgi:hypothetical protein